MLFFGLQDEPCNKYMEKCVDNKGMDLDHGTDLASGHPGTVGLLVHGLSSPPPSPGHRAQARQPAVGRAPGVLKR